MGKFDADAPNRGGVHCFDEESVGYLYNAIFQQLQSYRKAYYFDTIHLKNMCYHP